jgi:dTDP-glucose 4,6-dehydratase
MDHCDGIEYALKNGIPGEVYNIAGENEKENIFITNFIFDYLKKPRSLIKPVADRLGHDRRYSISAAKLHALGGTAI